MGIGALGVVNEMKLSVRYIGPLPDTGRMSALDIGPAIIGVSEMIAEASRVLYGDETRVRVEVRADIQHASFGLELFAVSALGDLIGSLTSDQLANLSQILGISVLPSLAAIGGGLVWFVRRQRNRKIKKVEPLQDDQIEITFEDDERISVSTSQFKVIFNPRIRKALRQVVRPLEAPGVDAVELRKDSDPPARILRGEAEDFTKAPMPEDEVSVDRSTAILEVISPSFKEGNKWRFAQGGPPFFADIEDAAFLAKVSRHQELFGSGDALRVEMEIRTTRSPDGLDFARTILRVIEHIQADRGGGQGDLAL